MFPTEVVETIKITFCDSKYFFSENRAVFKIMWKNIVQSDRPQLTIWRLMLNN